MEHLFSIMGLHTDHVQEICEDIKNQYESGVTSCALFNMTLVPEGNPPKDKAKFLTDKYMLFKEKLDEMKPNFGDDTDNVLSFLCGAYCDQNCNR